MRFMDSKDVKDVKYVKYVKEHNGKGNVYP